MNLTQLGNRFASLIFNAPKSRLEALDRALDSVETSKSLDDGLHGIRVVRDQWNAATPGGMSQDAFDGRGNAGPQESASGAGAARMTERYSDPALQSALVTGYADLGKRMEGMEAAVKAILGFITKAGEGSFPSDSRGNNGTAERAGEVAGRREDEDEDEDNDDIEAAEKALRTGELPISSIPKLLNSVASRSRHPGLASPPSFALGKSQVMTAEQRLMDAELPLADAMMAQSALAMARAANQGHADRNLASRRIEALPAHLKALIFA